MKSTRLLLAALLCACDTNGVHAPPITAPQHSFDVAPGACTSDADFVASNIPQMDFALANAVPGDVIAINGTIELPRAAPLNRPGITITCATPGSGFKLLPGASPAYLINVTAPQVTLRGLVLDARGTVEGAVLARHNGATLFGRELTLANNLVRCGPAICIFLVGTDHAIVDGNTFLSAATQSGVHMQGSGALTPPFPLGIDGSRIENNTLIAEQPSVSQAFGAIRVRDGAHVYVARNIVRGPWANDIAPSQLSNSRFEHNDLADAVGYGIRLSTSSIVFPSMTANTFLANKIAGAGQGAFLINSACGNAFVGNVIGRSEAPYTAVFEATSGGNVYVGNAKTIVDNGAVDCDGDGVSDANRISGQGKVSKGVAVGTIMRASSGIPELQ